MVGRVLGMAFNDVSPVKIDGKIIKSYDCWIDMLNRCYSPCVQAAQPRYVGCSVAEVWLLFSNFKQWFDSRYKPRYELDKDLLITGNRTYSPETCVLIPTALNYSLQADLFAEVVCYRELIGEVRTATERVLVERKIMRL